MNKNEESEIARGASHIGNFISSHRQGHLERVQMLPLLWGGKHKDYAWTINVFANLSELFSRHCQCSTCYCHHGVHVQCTQRPLAHVPPVGRAIEVFFMPLPPSSQSTQVISIVVTSHQVMSKHISLSGVSSTGPWVSWSVHSMISHTGTLCSYRYRYEDWSFIMDPRMGKGTSGNEVDKRVCAQRMNTSTSQVFLHRVLTASQQSQQ